MKNRSRKSLLAACALGVLALCSAAASRAADAPAAVDKPVAAFALPDVRTGKSVAVGDWQRARATVLIFIAVRCPFSNAYNARYNALVESYGDKGVRLAAVNSNATDSTQAVANHAKEHGFTFPILKDANNVIADQFGATTTPEVFVIDGNGVLRYHGRFDDSKDENKVTTHDLTNALDAILAGKEIAVKETNAFGCSIKREER